MRDRATASGFPFVVDRVLTPLAGPQRSIWGGSAQDSSGLTRPNPPSVSGPGRVRSGDRWGLAVSLAGYGQNRPGAGPSDAGFGRAGAFDPDRRLGPIGRNRHHGVNAMGDTAWRRIGLGPSRVCMCFVGLRPWTRPSKPYCGFLPWDTRLRHGLATPSLGTEEGLLDCAGRSDEDARGGERAAVQRALGASALVGP